MRKPVLLLPLLTAGCMVGPSYEPPDLTLPDRMAASGPTGEQEGEGLRTVPQTPETDWWRDLDDPLLLAYIDRAVAENHDLTVARARVRQARALRGVAGSALWPQVGLSADAGRSRASEEGIGIAQIAEAGLVDLKNDLYQVGFDARWEVDIFGKRRREVEATGARIEAAVESRRDVLLSVVAEVARNYVELRGAQERLGVARRNIEAQEETLDFIRGRFETGLAGKLELARQESLVEASRSRLPGLRVAIRAAAHRLGVLTGRAPAEVVAELLEPAPLPAAPPGLPPVLASDLLRRRPDVRRAERELHAATADIGVAVADLYPRFSISGLLGLESTSSGNLLRSSAQTWSVGGGLLAPLFQGGRIRANIAAVRARHEGVYARFEQAVLLALEDVETSMVAYLEQGEERRRLQQAAAASAESLRVARDLYDVGLSNYLEVLDAERSLLEVEDRLAASRTALITRWVALYKALGGGWAVAERLPGRSVDSTSF